MHFCCRSFHFLAIATDDDGRMYIFIDIDNNLIQKLFYVQNCINASYEVFIFNGLI